MPMGPSKKPKKRKKGSPPPRDGFLSLLKKWAKSGWFWLSTLLGLGALVITYATLRVNLSVEPTLTLNPVDPYKTQFTIKDENAIVGVHDIDSVCWPRVMESGNGFSVRSLGPLNKIHHLTSRLEPGGSDTIDCPPVIGGIGTYSGQVTYADLEIVVSFTQEWWRCRRTARYAFRTMKDSDNTVHWLHITPDEEKPIIPPRS
jgi:hypothetical protein